MRPKYTVKGATRMDIGNKNILLTLSIAVFILLLGACGQGTDSNTQGDDNQETSNISTNQYDDDEAKDNKVENPDIEVTLLGTGGPQLFPDRVGYSTLVEAGGQKLLFDTGRGVLQRLYESDIDIEKVTDVFYTHLHDDHTEGLPPLWMRGWLMEGRSEPMHIRGPEGTQNMIDGMRKMNEFNIENRPDDEHDVANLEVNVDEFENGKEGEVYDQDGVTVAVFPVEHDDGNPAFGYRIDYNDRSVVLSGDTSYHENVVEYGKGADLIVHNIVAISDEALEEQPGLEEALNKLTPPEDAAKVFEETDPKLAVYSHIVMHGISLDEMEDYIIDETREAGYDGPLEMGEDRSVIKIGDDVEISHHEQKE